MQPGASGAGARTNPTRSPPQNSLLSEPTNAIDAVGACVPGPACGLAHEDAPHAFYLDLTLLENYYDGGKYHHSASATLLYALREGLAAVHEEGLTKRWERHLRNHRRFVEGIENIGLTMLVREEQRLWTLNTPRVPEGVDDAQVRKTMLEKHGIEIAGGFGPLAGKIFRIGTMGEGANEEPICAVLAALNVAMGR